MERVAPPVEREGVLIFKPIDVDVSRLVSKGDTDIHRIMI